MKHTNETARIRQMPVYILAAMVFVYINIHITRSMHTHIIWMTILEVIGKSGSIKA